MGRVARALRFTLLGIALALPRASAQEIDAATRSAARTLGYSGVQAYQAGDYQDASRKLEQSFALLQAPSLGLWSARALAKLGKLIEAQVRYAAVARLSVGLGNEGVQQGAKRDADRERALLVPRIPSLRIQLEGAIAQETRVTLDDAVLAAAALDQEIQVNPGSHEVAGVRGEQRSLVSLTLGEGAHERALLRFSAQAIPSAEAVPASSASSPGGATEPSPPPIVSKRNSPWRTISWIAIGTGGAGLVTSVVAYLAAQGKYDDLPAGCKSDTAQDCPSSPTLDAYDTLRTVYLGSLITGGVLAATGVTLLVVTGSSDDGVALTLGPGSLTVAGRF